MSPISSGVRQILVLALVLLYPGLLLAQDGHIYWTDERAGKIQRSILDGTGVEDLVSATFVSPLSVAIHPDGDKLYWVDYDAATIQRSDLDGSNVAVVTSDLRSPAGLAFDSAAGHMYWKDGAVIQRTSLDGSLPDTLVTLTGPFYSGIFDIALHVSSGRMYWAHGLKIQRANLDGTEVEDIIDLGGSVIPLDIAVDGSAGKLYYSANDKILRRSNLDGTAIQQIGMRDGILDLALDTDSQRLYVASRSKIARFNLDGSDEVTLFETDSTPLAITLDAAGGDLYWTSYPAIVRGRMDGTERQDILKTAISAPTNLAVHSEANKMFWLDANLGKIQWANVDGTDVEDVVVSDGRLSAIALGDDRLYWVEDDTLRRASTDGTDGEKLMRTDRTVFLAIDTDGGMAYWTTWSTVSRAPLDGSGIAADIATDQQAPNGIALDVDRGKVYWTDGSADTIQRANLDGTEAEQLVGGLRGPYGIALDLTDEKMYWADINLGAIQRANLDGTDIEDLVTGLSNPHGIALQLFSGTAISSVPEPGHGFVLYQNYPNPLRGATTIQFSTERPGQAELDLFDALGRQVTSKHYAALPAGLHNVSLGLERLPAGLYWYRLTSDGRSATRSMVIVE